LGIISADVAARAAIDVRILEPLNGGRDVNGAAYLFQMKAVL
jgi:hypothetical protein